MLLTGFVPLALCQAQAMGKITLDGPSPLPMAAVKTADPEKEVAKPPALPTDFGMPRGVDVMANLGAATRTAASAPTLSSILAPTIPAAPVMVAAATADPAARTPAPLPPLESPQPPTAHPVAAPVAVAPPIGPNAEAAKPAGIEQQPIRGSGPEAVKSAGSDAKSAGLPGLGFGQVIAALAIVIGLIFVGRALARKFVPGAAASSGKGVIEILARHPLAKNQSLVLVRIGSQIVALNQGREASASVLVINEPMEVARIIGQIEGKNPASIQAGFNKLLANARMDLESGDEETDLKAMGEENLDEQLEEMAAAKRQLMELRQHVRSVRDSLPRE
jgi:flagellar biogenesis protein FliO